MSERKPTPPKPPTITVRLGRLSATMPVDAMLRLAPAAQRAAESFARLAATRPPNG